MRALIKILVSSWLLLAGSICLNAQEKQTFKGMVKDADGIPVAGATVTEKGTRNSAITDLNGNFSIKAAPNSTLVISYVGHQTLELAANSELGNIVLVQRSDNLDEVVVTSLGIKKETRSLGYAATTVKGDELVKTGTPNFATALYGKAPGVRINATPGGATSGVAIQVRGVNSINYSTTPLVIMDGVPVRRGTVNSNGDVSNGNYWGDQRIRGNGIIDFNPEDIESITVLKGASAAALYGSEAMDGVIVITTKSGKGKKGFAVDFNANYSQDKVAYLPRWQKQRGAGLPAGYLRDYSQQWVNDGGFDSYTLNGTKYRTMVPFSINFGPEFDGQPILSWDGQVRPYSYQEDGYANLFQKADNSTVNISFRNNTDKSSSRFSYTFQHTEGLSLNSENDKHNFNFNNEYKLGSKVTTNIVINYMNWHIHNRPYMVDRMINNFGGMFPAFDNGLWYINKHKTSLGYRYVTGSNQSLTPDENIKYGNFRGDIGDYVWRVLENNTDEYQNRINAVVSANWQIMKGLNFQVRGATDYTSVRTMTRNTSEVPLAFNYSGAFGIGTNLFTIVYGDALLTYNRRLTSDLQMTLMGGYNARTEEGYAENVSTSGGLTTENKFDLSSSRNTPYNSSARQNYFLTDAYFGRLNLDYKNFLYAEATVRRDRTSTMSPSNNSFVYPSVNAGFVFSDAFQLPEFISYAKLRGSWGIVGSYPEAYVANPAYNVGNLGNQGNGSVLTNTIRTNPYGNSEIKPEMKNEFEFGLETRMFKGRLSADITYYHANINDLILRLSIPQSSGAGSILSNVAALQNQGFEFGINGTVVQNQTVRWEAGINFAINKNKLTKLFTGTNELQHANHDGDALKRVSIIGHPLGDWYAHPIKTNDKGEKIVGGDGTYQIDGEKWEKYGNSLPKGSGGIWNTVSYSGFTLDFLMDFTYGGSVAPMGLYWLTSRGLTEQSTKIPEYAVRSGLSYWVESNTWVGHETTASQGPNGEPVMHDGIILGGVKADGTPNDVVISPAIYYWYSYNWGGPQYSNSLYFKYVNKNNYLKMRELSLSYTLPGKLASKIHANKLQLSVFGRNLFYIYRSIKDMDAEQLSAGSKWSDNLSNAGTNPSSRTFGASIRATF